jgi:hypothetical protein
VAAQIARKCYRGVARPQPRDAVHPAREQLVRASEVRRRARAPASRRRQREDGTAVVERGDALQTIGRSPDLVDLDAPRRGAHCDPAWTMSAERSDCTRPLVTSLPAF